MVLCMEMEVVELKVRIHCKACQKALRKSLCKIKGVKCVEIDAAAQKITVLGYVEHKAIVKAIHRTGRRAEPWPSSLSSAAVTPRLNKGFRCILPF
ncbi:hypothetical protein SLEP1_g13095 [Rubroshorea leprosula]|uniref:HMA domain-containing protein n=1 Tax=Rubroshorea leprosula TaxID=152421 RepID=A0AAV5IQ25_9ROSI|nr:hypothetical protein SLEP1_g13095 [Rubroshorea leprosula]